MGTAIGGKKYIYQYLVKSDKAPSNAGFAHFEQGFAQLRRELFAAKAVPEGRHNAFGAALCRGILSTASRMYQMEKRFL